MPIIGYNSQGASSFDWNNSLAQTLLDAGGTSPAAVTRTAVAGEQVDTVYFYCGGYPFGNSSGVDIGIYWNNAGTWTLEGSAVNIAGPMSTGWNSASPGSPILLTAGRVYAVALRIASSANINVPFNYESGATSIETLTGTSALPTTWSENYPGGAEQSFYAETSIVSSGNPKGPFGMPFNRPFRGPF